SLRYWWSQPDEFTEVVRFIVLRGERPIGFTQIDHARWDVQPERYASIRGDLMPTDRTRDALSALLAPMEERAIADGARILRVSANEDDALRSGTILGRGYRKDRHQRRWEVDRAGAARPGHRARAQVRDRRAGDCPGRRACPHRQRRRECAHPSSQRDHGLPPCARTDRLPPRGLIT